MIEIPEYILYGLAALNVILVAVMVWNGRSDDKD